MKKGMKKAMAGILTSAMVLSVNPTIALAAGPTPSLDKYGFDWSYDKNSGVYNRVMYFDIYNAAGIQKLEATFKVEVGGDLTDTTTGTQTPQAASFVMPSNVGAPADPVDEDEKTPADPVDEDEETPADPVDEDEETPADPADEDEKEEPAADVKDIVDENVEPTGLDVEPQAATTTTPTEYYVKVESTVTISQSKNTDRWWFSIDKSDKTTNKDQTVAWYSDADMTNLVTDVPFANDAVIGRGTDTDHYKNATVKISDIELKYGTSSGSTANQTMATDLDGLDGTFNSTTNEDKEVNYFVAPAVTSTKFEWTKTNANTPTVPHKRVLTFEFGKALDKDIKGLKATFDAKVAGVDYKVEVTSKEDWKAVDVTKWWFSIDKSDQSDQDVKWVKSGETNATDSPFVPDESADDPKSVTITNLQLSYSTATKQDGSVDYTNCTAIDLTGATKTGIGERIFKDGKFEAPAATKVDFAWKYTHDTDNSTHNRVMRFDFDKKLHGAVTGLKATFNATVGNEAYTVEVTEDSTGWNNKWWFCIDDDANHEIVWKKDGNAVANPFASQDPADSRALKITNVKLFYKTTEDTAATNAVNIKQDNVSGTTYTSGATTIAAPKAKTASFTWQYTHGDGTKHNRVMRFDFDGALNKAVTNLKATFKAEVDGKAYQVEVTEAVSGAEKWWFSIDKSVANAQQVTWLPVDATAGSAGSTAPTTPFPNDELYGDKTVKISDLKLYYNTDNATSATWNEVQIADNQAMNTFDKDGVVTPGTNPGGGSNNNGTTNPGGGGGSSKPSTKPSTSTTTDDEGNTTTTTTDKNGNTTVTETKKDGTVIETTTKKDGTVTETVTEPDGTVTETVTDADGNQTETVTTPDGTTTTTETTTEGTVTETIVAADGSTATVTTDADGKTEANANLSNEAVAEAQANNQPVTVPVTVSAGNTSAEAPTITISVPDTEEGITIEIPVEDVTNSTVIVLVHEDGTEEIVKTTAITENGLSITVSGDVQVKIVENKKEFNDVEDHWAENDIAFLSARELMSGVGEDNFGPGELMTRGMVNTVLARLSGVDTSGGDVWYEVGTKWAVENGISDGTYPEGNVTRQQLATILYRFAGSPAVEGSLDYTDAGDVDAYAQQAMLWATQNGIMSGMGDGTLAPQDNATRAQVAAMLARYIRNFM